MGKSILHLYVDSEIISIAKSQGFNLSREVSNYLSILTKNLDFKNASSEQERIVVLETKISNLMGSLDEKTKECVRLQRELQKAQADLIKISEKLKRHSSDIFKHSFSHPDFQMEHQKEVEKIFRDEL